MRPSCRCRLSNSPHLSEASANAAGPPIMKMSRGSLLALVTVAACAAAHTQVPALTPDCVSDTTRASQNRSIDPSQLAGTFRLAQIWTEAAAARRSDSVSYSTLQLAIVDSARRAGALVRSLGHQPRRDLQLIGTVRARVGHRAEPAEVDAGILYLGCRDCTDASPEVLVISVTTEEGFTGTWRDYQTGIGHLIDTRTGQLSADPGGYFCAWRE